MHKITVFVWLASTALWSLSTSADSTQARCDIYPKGSDTASDMLPCTFSQRQGYITIRLENGTVHDLTPKEDAVGNYLDQNGRPVYRQSGMGDQGLIFSFENENIWVYWSTAGLYPTDENNATAPFSTADYDATALLNCRAAGDREFGNCPAGILRMENQQASVTVLNQMGERFTINFLTDVVNATNREVTANLEGDTWTVTVENGEVYEVPFALIVGD